jgi:hypothetical protein
LARRAPKLRRYFDYRRGGRHFWWRWGRGLPCGQNY